MPIDSVIGGSAGSGDSSSFVHKAAEMIVVPIWWVMYVLVWVVWGGELCVALHLLYIICRPFSVCLLSGGDITQLIESNDVV